MVEATFDPSFRFERALVRLIRSFNYLDTNVGLCISHLENPGDTKRSYPSLASMTAEQRMKKLKQLFKSNNIAIDTEGNIEFTSWCLNTDKARAVRNRYVHGNWEYIPLRHEKPVSISAPAWMKDKLGKLATENMSLDELEAVADEMEDTLNEFMTLRRKYSV